MVASLIVWVGLAAAFVGLLGVVRPVRSIGLWPRRRAAMVVLAGVFLATVGLVLPAPAVSVARATTELDRIIPSYQFSETHSRRVDAPSELVYQAMRQVTAGEIPLFQQLTWIRRLGRSTRESILNAPDTVPIIDVAARTGFLLLAADAPRELVVGSVVLAPDGWRRSAAATPADFSAIHGDGFATAVMNFHIVPDGDRASTITTETRVFATDAATRRRFAVYWRVIYPGSALIRRMWLRAIARRAGGVPVIIPTR